MSAILEETNEGTKVVFPRQPDVVDIAGDDDIIVAPIDVVPPVEDVIVAPSDVAPPEVPIETVVETRSPAQFHVGSKPNVVYVLSEKHDVAKLNTFYVLIKDLVAVMVRNQSDATLEDLQCYLLQKYETGLVTPTFSADNVQKSLGKYEIV